MKSIRSLIAGLALSATATLNAKIVTMPVASEHAGAMIEGYLAYDDSKVSAGRLALGVLVVPEWWGLDDSAKGRAKQLAELGYVAFAADMKDFFAEIFGR